MHFLSGEGVVCAVLLFDIFFGLLRWIDKQMAQSGT